MEESIAIIEQPAQPTLAIATRASTLSMAMLMGKVYGKLMQYIQAKGAQMTGMPYALYKNVDWYSVTGQQGFWFGLKMMFHKWDLEIGMPVTQATEGEGEIIATEIPAGRYLKALHRGPYKTMGQTYNRMTAYAREHNLSIGDHALELYLNDPRAVGPEGTETEIHLAIKE